MPPDALSKCRGRNLLSSKLIMAALLVFALLHLNLASSHISSWQRRRSNPKAILEPIITPPPQRQKVNNENSVAAEPDLPPESTAFYTLTPRAHRHCTPPPDPQPGQLHLVIWVSNQDNPAYANFLLSVNRLGYRNLHMVRPPGDTHLNESTMWSLRMVQLRDFFKTLPKDTLILAVDCYDVIFIEGPQELQGRYERLGSPVVAGAEMLCDTVHCRHNSGVRDFMKRNAPAGNRYRYLNGGTVMGRSADLIRVFEMALALMSPGEDDQIGLARVYRAHPHLLSPDFNSTLFGVLPPSYDLLDLEWSLGAGNYLPTQAMPYSPDWAQIHRRGQEDSPAVLHFPGMRYMGDEYQLFNPCQCELGTVYNYVGNALLGVTEEQARAARVVVSLTTIPARLKNLLPTLRSVVNQTLTPAKIYLNLPRPSTGNEQTSRFHDQHYEIPEFIHTLPDIVTVNWCREYGPATKLIPTLQKERDPNTVIITIDDDMIYKPGFVMHLTRQILAWPHAAFGYAGQMIDTQGRSPIVRSADEWRTRLAAVDIMEAFKGAAYLRAFFDDSIENIANVCYRTDDIHISAHLARKWIPRIKLPQSIEDCPQPSANDEVAPLREENVYGQRKNDLCAAYLLDSFQTMWTDHVTACPVRFEWLSLPPLKDFPLGTHYSEDMPVLKCNVQQRYFQIGEGTTQLQTNQYFKQGQSLYSPGGTRLTLMPQGKLCITHVNGNTHCLQSTKVGQGDLLYHATLQSDGKLCIVEGEDPRNSGNVFRCMSALISEKKCPRPTLSMTDEGMIGLMCG